MEYTYTSEHPEYIQSSEPPGKFLGLNVLYVTVQQQQAWAEQWPGHNLPANGVQPQHLGVPREQPQLPTNGRTAAKVQPSQHREEHADSTSTPQPSALTDPVQKPYQPELYADVLGQSPADTPDAKVIPIIGCLDQLSGASKPFNSRRLWVSVSC